MSRAGPAGAVAEWGWTQDNAIFIRIPGPNDPPVNFSAVNHVPLSRRTTTRRARARARRSASRDPCSGWSSSII